jgi:hypothetical protein
MSLNLQACMSLPHMWRRGQHRGAAPVLLLVDAGGQRVRGVCARAALEEGAMLMRAAIMCSGHYGTLEMVAHFFARALLQAAHPAGSPHATAPRVLERTKAEVRACMSRQPCMSA